MRRLGRPDLRAANQPYLPARAGNDEATGRLAEAPAAR